MVLRKGFIQIFFISYMSYENRDKSLQSESLNMLFGVKTCVVYCENRDKCYVKPFFNRTTLSSLFLNILLKYRGQNPSVFDNLMMCQWVINHLLNHGCSNYAVSTKTMIQRKFYDNGSKTQIQRIGTLRKDWLQYFPPGD